MRAYLLTGILIGIALCALAAYAVLSAYGTSGRAVSDSPSDEPVGIVDATVNAPYVAVKTASASCGTTATATCPAGMRVYGEYKCETSCPLDPADCPGVNQLGNVSSGGADQGATSASQVSRTCGGPCSWAYVTILCTNV